MRFWKVVGKHQKNQNNPQQINVLIGPFIFGSFLWNTFAITVWNVAVLRSHASFHATEPS